MRKAFAQILVAVVALVAGGAVAAPTEQKVSKTVHVAAPPDKVWGVIQDFGDATWIPVVKSSNADKGDTPGSLRVLDLGGPKLREQLVHYDAQKMSYSYKITDDPENVKSLPVTHYKSTITVKPGKESGSIVTWHGTFLRADPSDTPADGQDNAAAVKAVTGVYEAGLGSIKKKAESP